MTACSRRVLPAPRARRPDDTFQARWPGGTSEVYATAAFLPVSVTRRIGPLTAADLFRRVVTREGASPASSRAPSLLSGEVSGGCLDMFEVCQRRSFVAPAR